MNQVTSPGKPVIAAMSFEQCQPKAGPPLVEAMSLLLGEIKVEPSFCEGPFLIIMLVVRKGLFLYSHLPEHVRRIPGKAAKFCGSTSKICSGTTINNW